MFEGWIKMHRKTLDSDMFRNLTATQRDVFTVLLMLANHKEKTWEWGGQLFSLKPGQLITSLESLKKYCAKDTTIQNIRTALRKLEKWGFLTNKSTKTGRLITICNWGIYQGDDTSANKQSNKQLTNNQQTTNKQLTTNKNDKNEKNEENNNNYILKDIVCDTAEVSPTPSDKIVALKNKNPNTPYSQIVELYNDTCGAAFGMVTSLSVQRKKHLKILFRDLNHDLDTIRHLFIKAKESDFLRGHNKRSWRATFDWLIKINNAVKVLDGNYDNKHTGGELEAVFARFLAKEN